MSEIKKFTYEGRLIYTTDPLDLWPSPIITTCELIEGVLKRCEIAEMNGEPLSATSVLRGILRLMRKLEMNDDQPEVRRMKRLRLFFHLWRVFGFAVACDFWTLRCPRCHKSHDFKVRCVI